MKTWIYIVTWCVTFTITGTVDVVDEFGRYQYSVSDTSFEEDCDHYKHFWDRDSAIAFYNRALRETRESENPLLLRLYTEEPLTNVVLDSVDYVRLIEDIRLIEDTLIYEIKSEDFNYKWK